MKPCKVSLCISIFAIGILLFSLVQPVSADETASGKKWSPKFSFEYRGDRSRSLARFDALIPLWQQHNALFFSDLRYIDTSGPGIEGNLGLGYRRLSHNLPLLGGDSIWGTYAFFDRRKTSLENYFSQITIGAELLTPDWSLRANGYLPDKTGYVVGTRTGPGGGGGPTLSGTTVVSGTGGTTIVDKEWALPGFDVEIGTRFETIADHALWLFAGYFNFDRAETVEISGPRARLEYRMHDLFDWTGSIITLGAEIRDDDIGGTNGLVLARLSIPIGKTKAAAQGFERRMMEFVQRDVDVVTLVDSEETAGAGAPPVIVDPESGEILNVYVVNDAGTGDCTQANPCSLPDVAADRNYGSGDVIVLLDSAGNVVGDIDLTTTVGSLGSDRRQVVGGVGDIVLHLSSGDDLSLSGLGGRPTLEGSVTLANESQLIGFDIVSPGTAIFGSGVDSPAIRNIHVINAENNALHLQGATGAVTVSGFSVQQAGGTDIFLDTVSADVTLGNSLVQNSGQGLVVQNNTGDMIFSDLTIDNPNGTAIDLSGAGGVLVFNNVNISGLGSATGLNLNGSSADVTMNALNITGTGAPGSVGVDMRGATGALRVANAGTIQNVVTAFDFNAASDATVDFRNGAINAGIPVNTVGVSNGEYDFTGTTFIKDNTLSLETGFGSRFYFVDATGDGPGTPDDPTSIDFAEVNANEGDIIFLVEDGTGNIVATEGLQLRDQQQLVGFGGGDALIDFTGANPHFLGRFAYTVTDPTGNGAATLQNNGGSTVLGLASDVQVRDFTILTTGTTDGISGQNFSGASLHNIDVSGAGNRGIRLVNASGEILISDSRFIDAVGKAFEITGGDADIRVANSVILGGQTDLLIDISGTTGGSVIFDAGTTISSFGNGGIRLSNLGGDITFNGPVDILAFSSFTPATVDGVTATGLGISTVSFNDRLTIITENGSGVVVSGGNLNIAGGRIDAFGGTGITASNTTVDIVLDSLSASAGTDGLDLSNVTGTITILDRP